MTTPTSSSPSVQAEERRYVGDIVRDVAGELIPDLQRGYRKDVASAVARLAQLRRGAGKLPADVPELFGLTGADLLYQHQTLSDTEAVRAEAALFVTLTLYALHQQSRPDGDMHRPGLSFGAAVRRLMGDEIDEPIRKRFSQIGTSSTLLLRAERLRGMVKLLRAESIPLDYAQLARQLYQTQCPGGLTQARDAWSRGFHAYRLRTTDATTPSSVSKADTNEKDL